ncbi:MAG: hypothetical protein AAF986_06635 [Pseudomonadota bacterium]
MRETLTEEIKRWTANRKSALVIEIVQGVWGNSGQRPRKPEQR